MSGGSTAWRLGVIAVVCVACVLAGCGGPATPTEATPGTAPTSTASTGVLISETDAVAGLVAEASAGEDRTIDADDGDSVDADDRTRVIVTDVIDGDTMDVAYANGTTDTIRLLGVDTPEVHVETQPREFEGVTDSESGRTWLSEWGDRSSEFARETLLDERITIATSERADRRGRYGRLLVTVRVDGTLFNRALLEDGYARLYDGPFATGAGFERVERRAQDSKVGVWGFEPG